jgi:tRNA dimethylallyltransferase
VVLLGPTAAGKTPLSVRWGKALQAEVVSADSVQVYRGMDIGTAKPSPAVRGEVPHHLVDVVDPDDTFSAARFQGEADRAIQGICNRGRNVLVVGGTGLYLRALVRGLFPGPDDDPTVRERLHRRASREGGLALHAELAASDPAAASRIHPNDLLRVVRALEVFYRTGVPISLHQERHGFSEERYPVLYLGLEVDRRTLCRRIEARADQMMARGLLEEVAGLMARGYGSELPAMGALGYRHMAAHLRGEMTLERAVETLKRDTRRFARRQMTWFRSMAGVRWFAPEAQGAVLDEIRRFLDKTSHRP